MSVRTIENTPYTLTEDAQIEVYEKIENLHPLNDFNYSWDDVGLANLFVAIYGDELCYCPDVKTWYNYEDGTWYGDSIGLRATQGFRDMIQLLKLYTMSYQPNESEDKDGKERFDKYKAFLTRASTHPMCVRVLSFARDLVAVGKDQFDRDPYMLHCTNGAYNMRTHKFRPALPSDYFTRCTAVPYSRGYRGVERWYTFVDEITSHDKDKAWYLQKALGYSLLGDPKEECMFIAYGKTRCGKGTLFNTIATVLGMGKDNGYGGTVSSSLLTENRFKDKDYNAPQPMLADTPGLRYVTISETKQDAVLDEAGIKALTGRDPIKTRQLHCPAFTFTPQFTIWLSTNFLPKVSDGSVFSSNRIRVIPFNEHFDETNGRDNNLKEQFLTHDGKQTVLMWLIDGYEGYAKEGLTAPASVVEATRHYESINDRIGNFIGDCIEECSTGFVRNKTLYATYKAWCADEERDYRPLGSTSFYKEMEKHFERMKQRTDDGQVHGFVGISLREEHGTVRIV